MKINITKLLLLCEVSQIITYLFRVLKKSEQMGKKKNDQFSKKDVKI